MSSFLKKYYLRERKKKGEEPIGTKELWGKEKDLMVKFSRKISR